MLVVNDSAVIRQRLKSIIESDSRFCVVLAADPYEAVERLKLSVPGVIVLDVEMPRMDGLTFLKKLMRQHPLPVVLCTTQAERAVTALEMGAMEVIPKPDWTRADRLPEWSQNLLESIRNAARPGACRCVRTGPRPPIAATRPMPSYRTTPSAAGRHERAHHRRRHQHGGRPGPAPVVAGLQLRRPGRRHRAAHATGIHPGIRPAARQRPGDQAGGRRGTSTRARPPRAGAGHPGDKHGLIRRAGAGFRVELVEGPPVCRHRPSVEVLFRSAAQAAGPFAAGVIMTGMGDDGAVGLLEMREAGALTIAQNEATCTVFGMPREAIRRGAARSVIPLDAIAAAIMAWVASSSDTGTWH